MAATGTSVQLVKPTKSPTDRVHEIELQQPSEAHQMNISWRICFQLGDFGFESIVFFFGISAGSSAYLGSRRQRLHLSYLISCMLTLRFVLRHNQRPSFPENSQDSLQTVRCLPQHSQTFCVSINNILCRKKMRLIVSGDQDNRH